MSTFLHKSFVVLLVLLASVLATDPSPAAVADSVSVHPAAEMPDELMRAFLAASAQPFMASESGYRAEAGGLELMLAQDGVQAVVGEEVWEIGLRGFGREQQINALPAAVLVQREGEVAYRRGPLVEWYRDTALGLQQGVTVEEAPEGDGALVLELAVPTGWAGVVDTEGRGLSFASRGERTVHDELGAWDSAGEAVPITISAVPGRVVVHVEDEAAAYPLSLEAVIFLEEQKVVAPDGEPNDNFGLSVALDGDTALVGAPYDDIGANAAQGSAYVFARSGVVWSFQQQLLAPGGEAADRFGGSVALDGDTALVGADGIDFDPGSAYVFTRSGTVWSFQQQLVAPDRAEYDHFGYRVALDGDTALVGADGDDVGANFDQGSAYVFVRSGVVWSLQQKLLAPDGTWGDQFGYSVALDGETALVGAFADSIGANLYQGSAYVFVRSGAVWSFQDQLLAPDGAADDVFGFSLALDGDTALVGARFNDIGENVNQGSAYVFERSGTVWSFQQQLLAPDGTSTDNFGFSVALDGETALVGALFEDWDGSAYVFTRNGAVWSFQQKVSAPGGEPRDHFSIALALDGDTALVGAPADDLGANTNQGSAHFYQPDAAPAIVSIIRASADPSIAASVNFTVTFSQEVTGVDVDDFEVTTTGTLTGASVSGLTGAGASYNVTAHTGTGDGTLRLDMPATATVSDLLDNALLGLPYAAGEVFTIDRTAPVVLAITRTDPDPTNAATVDFDVTFSEDVTSVGVDDFALTMTGTLSGASVSGLNGTGMSYTVTVTTGTGEGTLRLDVPATATVTDLVGLALSELPYTSGEVYTIDRTAPMVLTMARAGVSPTSAASVGFLVTLSEDVTELDVGDFALMTTGTLSGASVSSVSGSGAAYVVTAATGTGEGTLRLDVPATATVADLLGNALAGLPYTDGESYTLDRAAPVVVAIARTNPSPTGAVSVGFEVTFSEDVTGVGVDDFELATTGTLSGGSVRRVSGSGASYVVTAATGTGEGTLRLDVPAMATVADLLGNALTGLAYVDGEVYAIERTVERSYYVYLPMAVERE